jgi:indolepyruvate ferredoxin oxidoreductase
MTSTINPVSLANPVSLVNPVSPAPAAPNAEASGPHEYELSDRYGADHGSVYLTGIQALVRMVLDRADLDAAHGRSTSTLVTGYEGSPLAGYDLELARNLARLSEHRIVHRPALNEELAATALLGSQLAGTTATLIGDGVTGFWYGKAPGLDRASDAIRHANLAGTSPTGGVVLLVGDDPIAKSSTLPCVSELTLADLAVPTFYPADSADVLALGRHAVELSRASGLWTAMKITTNVADAGGTVTLGGGFAVPDLSGSGLRAYSHRPNAHLIGAPVAALERSLFEVRLPLAAEYGRVSGVNSVLGSAEATVGIITSGKAYLDVRQALTLLGIDEQDLDRLGIRLLRLGLIHPLHPETIADFAAGLREVIVVEEKRPVLESAVKEILYSRAQRPVVVGKTAPDGHELFSPSGELDPLTVARGLRRRLVDVIGAEADARLSVLPEPRRPRPSLALLPRTPAFCSGCPHNTSTKVTDNSLVGAGIGCHAMVVLMRPDQVGDVIGVTQMGGEGAQWLGMAPFVTEAHFTQNIGDGTFAHSGSLAIRAAVAAGADITFKLLYNSAVAMTGGQQAVGAMDLAHLTAVLQAENVARIVVTTERLREVRRQLPRQVEVRHRDDLLAVQSELATVAGVTVLIHDQECAAQKRRKRHRGTEAPASTKAFINQRVCEGCGDCGSVSNCLSVQPVDTEFGRKTHIDQSSCNADFSCLKGDCPSFLSVRPGRPGVAVQPAALAAGELPEPPRRFGPERFAIRITGVGGTGIVTVAQILATAAISDGLQVRGLDQTGLAQKGGAVVSDLKFSAGRLEQAAKLDAGECDLYLGCDSLVAADQVNLTVADSHRTIAVVSSTEVPTGSMISDPRVEFPALGAIRSLIDAHCHETGYLDARAESRNLFGDDQYANLLLVGVAYQRGLVPIAAASIERAITLNGVAVATNLQAFRRGRHFALTAQPGPDRPVPPIELDQLMVARAADLTEYQNDRYAADYLQFVETVRRSERAALGDSTVITEAVAVNLYKLMAYKDEYEVARLSLDPVLKTEIEAEFGPGSRRSYLLHPPVLRALGLTKKISLGPWFDPAFRGLRAARRLRGTALDPFGYAGVRRVERALIVEYREAIQTALAALTPDTAPRIADLAGLPQAVRGYEQIKLANVERYRRELGEALSAVVTGAA